MQICSTISASKFKCYFFSVYTGSRPLNVLSVLSFEVVLRNSEFLHSQKGERKREKKRERLILVPPTTAYTAEQPKKRRSEEPKLKKKLKKKSCKACRWTCLCLFGKLVSLYKCSVECSDECSH